MSTVTLTSSKGCTVSALKHRVDRLKKKVNIPESKVRASPSISPRKSTTTTPTKGRRASVMKATKFKRSPKKANNLASESETSEPESPKLEPDSESDDEENDDLLKEEDSDLILVKEEDPAVSKEKDKDVTADTEEEEEY